MRRIIVAVLFCLSLIAGGTLIAHAGSQAPYISSYIYDANMSRYFDIDMDEPGDKPEVECVVMEPSQPATDMLFRTKIGDWRIMARWTADRLTCDVMIWQEGPTK